MAKVTSLSKRDKMYAFDNPSQEEIDYQDVEELKRQVKLLHQGFIVQVVEVKSCDESSNFVTVKVTLNSTVNQMPVFGDVKLKLTKQAAQKLKNELARVS